MATAASRSFATGAIAGSMIFSASSHAAARAATSAAAPDTSAGTNTSDRAAEGVRPPVMIKKADIPTATAIITAIAAKSVARRISTLLFFMR